MKILFLTIARISEISARGIYTDLMRKFSEEGHELFIATPTERRYKEKTSLIKNNNATILRIKTLNIQKTNILEKGLSTILIEKQFHRSIKKHLPKIHFDLVLYSTPPITFTKVVKYIKQKDGAKSYLLLKDIFPQNAVDMGLISSGSLIHRYFRRKEKELYAVSDYIGCMSPANFRYVCKHNPEINPEIVEVNPNSIDPSDSSFTPDQRVLIRKKYLIPEPSTVFIYGGNLGKPQGIGFLIDLLVSQMQNKGVFFIIVGSGTEYAKIDTWFQLNQPENALLISELSKKEYDLLVQSSDVGMIFLDRSFTIPNFPSRLLSYMEYKLPVIAATDRNTDLGNILEENQFGLWSEAEDHHAFNNNIARLTQSPALCTEMGQNGYDYLIQNYTVSNSYDIIINHFT